MKKIEILGDEILISNKAFNDLAKQMADDMKFDVNESIPMTGLSKQCSDYSREDSDIFDAIAYSSGVYPEFLEELNKRNDDYQKEFTWILNDMYNVFRITPAELDNKFFSVDKIESSKSCSHTWKTYDSGWRKFDYCTICNQEKRK